MLRKTDLLRCVLRPSAFVLALALVSQEASAQPTQSRSVLVLHAPPRPPPGMRILVEIDGRPLPREALDTQMIVLPGKRLVRTSVIDVSGRPVLEPEDRLVTVVPGAVTEMNLPGVVSDTDGTLIGGGVAVTVLGTMSGVWSVLSFVAADAAGTDCHESGFAKDLCGVDPAPWLGMGVTGLLFGVAGIVGGSVMIANGAERTPMWVSPSAGPGFAGASVGLRF